MLAYRRNTSFVLEFGKLLECGWDESQRVQDGAINDCVNGLMSYRVVFARLDDALAPVQSE